MVYIENTQKILQIIIRKNRVWQFGIKLIYFIFFKFILFWEREQELCLNLKCFSFLSSFSNTNDASLPPLRKNYFNNSTGDLASSEEKKCIRNSMNSDLSEFSYWTDFFIESKTVCTPGFSQARFCLPRGEDRVSCWVYWGWIQI